MLPSISGAEFGGESFSGFPGMQECPGTQWMSVAMPWLSRACALRLIGLAGRCPGPGTRCAVGRNVACGSRILPLSSLHAVGMCFYSLWSCGAQIRSPTLGINDLGASRPQVPVAGPPSISIGSHCCGSHFAIVWAQSICPSHLDPCNEFGFFLSCPAASSSCGCGVIIQRDGPDTRYFTQGQPVHALSCLAILMLLLEYCAYQCTRTGVLV